MKSPSRDSSDYRAVYTRGVEPSLFEHGAGQARQCSSTGGSFRPRSRFVDAPWPVSSCPNAQPRGGRPFSTPRSTLRSIPGQPASRYKDGGPRRARGRPVEPDGAMTSITECFDGGRKHAVASGRGSRLPGARRRRDRRHPLPQPGLPERGEDRPRSGAGQRMMPAEKEGR